MKRIISLLTAIVMCVSLLPVLPAGAAAPEYTIDDAKNVVYNLTLNAFDKTALTGMTGYDGSKIYTTGLKNVGWSYKNSSGAPIMICSESNAPWALDYYFDDNDKTLSSYHSSNRIESAMLRIDFFNAAVCSTTNKTYYENGFTGNRETTRPYFIVRTYVPNAGIYDISVKGIKNGNGGISDVYLAKAEKDFYGPGDVAELIGKAEYIGEADTKTGVNISRQKFSFDRGEYVYIFVPSEKSKDLGTITDAGKVPARNYLSEIRLVPVLSFDTAKLTLSDDDNTVTTGTYLYPGVEAFDKKGNPCSLEYAVITYESDNTDVAEVDEKTGEIYTKRPGKAKITVTAEDDIAKVSDSVELTVISRGEQTLLPAEIKAGFPLVDVEVGETARLKVTDEVGNELGDGVEYSYAIADESVMTEKDGTFTAVKTGKTDITVKAALGGEVKETTVTAAVVGKNLFTRDGVRHGEFENSVFLNPNGDTEVDLSGGEVRAKTIWKATKDRVRDIYEFTHFKNVASEITGRRTSYIKAAVDDTSYEGITEDGDRTFRIETGTNTTYAPQLENGKIYEYTGFVKLENARTIPTIQIRHQIYKVSDGTEIGKDLIDIYPFSSATGDFPWSRFLVGPFCANWEEDVIARSKVQATSVDPIGYELSISHLALREVEFEYVDFKIEGYFEGAETYDKFITTAVPMSNTGHEIFVGNTGTEIKVNYSSSDPVVARVDDNGVITAVSDGDCEIYADITLGSVTRRGIIPVHLEGLEVMLGSIVATADCELNVGETTCIEAEYFNTDATANSGEGAICYYETSNPEIAEVSQSGVITARNPGKTVVTVYVSVDGVTVKQELEIKVTDEAPLASAYIEGADKVEIGFTVKLDAGAYHTSGTKADMTERAYSFSLKNPEDELILSVAEDGTAEGLSEGSATVVLTVENPDGEPLTAEHTVDVVQGEAKRKIIDFRVYTVNTSILNAEIEKDGWEVNCAETSQTRIEEGKAGVYGKLRFLAHGIQFRTQAVNSIEGDLAFDIAVDYEGWYNISFVGARRENGCHVLTYMNGEYLGECSFEAPDDDSNSDFTAKLNPVYLKKGINTFKLRADVSAKYLYPARITLDYIGEEAPVPQSVALDLGKTTVPFSTVLSPSVTAKMSRGHDYVFGLDFGFVVNNAKKYTLTSDKPSVVKVTDDGRLEAVGEGNARITANVTYGDYFFEPYVDITVTPKGFTTVSLSADKTVMAPDGEGSQITVRALDNLGDAMVIPVGTEIVYATSDGSIVTVDENGHMTPHGEGSAVITATLTLDGITLSGSLNVSVRHGKIKSTYYTDDKIETARENIKKYSWAREEKKKAVEKADAYLPYVDYIYDLVPSPDIPRGYLVGWFDDPDVPYCRYCGKYLLDEYGKYPWEVDVLNRPWKVQCPDCKRLFPSNDFEGLYELVTENNYGIYDVELAHELNEKVKQETGGKVDYLKNTLYPEVADQVTVANGGSPGVKVTINVGKGLRPGETADGWGVDDGLGYMPKKPDGTHYSYAIGDDKVPEVHSYIAVFAHLIWDDPAGKRSAFRNAVEYFCDAYIYTGDEKYGIAGAVLLDRMADYYPAYDLYNDGGYDFERETASYQNTGGSGLGKIIGNIWEADDYLGMFATCYDAFFELYDDPRVVEFLTGKAENIGLFELAQSEDERFDKYDRLSNKFVVKDSSSWEITPETLRENVEEGLLKEALPAVKTMQIAGNFGFKQNTLAKCAVVLDTQPYTQEIIDFIMAPGEANRGVCTGGNVMSQIINIVDRDGFGNESSLNYNRIWALNLLEMAQTLGDYEDVELEDDLLANPKYIKMLSLDIPSILASKRQPSIGDMGTAVSASFNITQSLFLAALDSIDKWNASEEFKEEKRVLFSQAIYLGNGNTTDELHYDIFTKNPESIKKSIEDVIEEYGEYDIAKSSVYSGYGFAALRDGVNFSGETLPSNIDNTTRDFFIYFGGGDTSHHHYDGLSLGMDAYGIDMMPELGYPSSTGGNSNYVRANWSSGTVSHNTVVVNDERQRKTIYSGNPLHFDDSGEVKVMDVEMPEVYGKYVDTYRRTLVSVDVDDTVSYGIDFFRIIGGDEHIYSFHSRAFEAELDEKIKTVQQPVGTYAGADVSYGDLNYSIANDSGYEYLDNVSRAVNPQTGEFEVDFEIEKINNIPVTKQDWHLRMTMLNDFKLSEIALADGYAPQYGENPTEPFRYVLARRSGKNLDTLFTTVLEPYVGKSNIKSLERVPVTKNGKPVQESEGVAAVKVTLNNGRVDYAVYATDNTVTYRVDDLFDFSGFIGVYTVPESDEENCLRTYLLDGTKLGEVSETAAITGKITDFTHSLEFENYVEIELDESIQENTELVGRLLNVENDGQQNGAYTITSAELSGNTLKLGVGDVTFIRSYVDSFDTSKGYYYNIEEGQRASIALSSYNTSAPDIAPIENQTVSAGSTIKIPVNASSAYGRNITLEGTTLPRGMSINAETGTLTWRPDASQVGDNHVAITVDDGVLTSTVRFTVTVYGSTIGGASSNKTDEEKTEIPSTPAGGGGGGAAPETSDKTDNGETDTSGKTDDESLLLEEKVPSTGEADEVENVRFIDLSNHAWAADAINALANDGVVKGTSATTYSPASNITRADFALLLVRAFELTSDNAENFADVSANDYFAPELAIARNTGIVNGVGDNKYAPRNTITRQDMMVIVHRALKTLEKMPSLPKGGGTAERRWEDSDGGGIYPDYDTVAPYARDAVSALISAGLVNGKSGHIAPTDYTTRAEVAVLIKRILDYTKK